MTFKPDAHQRRSIRLKEYDYAQAGAYFITVCTQRHVCLLGDIQNDRVVLTDAGRMILTVWDEMPGHYPSIATDAFIIMPNHVHGIIILVGATPCGCPQPIAKPNNPATGQAQGPVIGQARGPAPTLSLPDAVHRFKSLTTKQYSDGVNQHDWPPFMGRLWQRNYYEHVIRDDADLNRIRQYIADNPLHWALDRENPLFQSNRN